MDIKWHNCTTCQNTLKFEQIRPIVYWLQSYSLNRKQRIACGQKCILPWDTLYIFTFNSGNPETEFSLFIKYGGCIIDYKSTRYESNPVSLRFSSGWFRNHAQRERYGNQLLERNHGTKWTSHLQGKNWKKNKAIFTYEVGLDLDEMTTCWKTFVSWIHELKKHVFVCLKIKTTTLLLRL